MAQGINRLVQEGCLINQVVVHCDENYLSTKVTYTNSSILAEHQRNDYSSKFRVLLPQETRHNFLTQLIHDAKQQGQFGFFVENHLEWTK